ncbi:hypothetical protein JB92DRAFT_2824656 [Gautieria morchelliformis]|nr:hypothetical protein JB92DRAFT_2824656 [Gautieria morchelliformis]
MFELSLNFDTSCTPSLVPIGDSRVVRATSVVMTAAVILAAIWTMPWVQARLPTALRQQQMIPGTAAYLGHFHTSVQTTTLLMSADIANIVRFGVWVKRISRMDGSDMVADPVV